MVNKNLWLKTILIYGWCLILGWKGIGVAEYIQSWLICGPFENKDHSTRLKKDYLYGENSQVPDINTYAGGLIWKPYTFSNERVYFLSSPVSFTISTLAVAYAHTYVYVPETQEVELVVGSDDGIAIWVNSNLIHFNDIYRTYSSDSDIVKTKLQAGWNRLLFKISQAHGDWLFSCGIRKPDGISPVLGLKFQTTNPGIPLPNKPAEIKVVDVIPDAMFTFTRDNIVKIGLKLQILNLGTRPATGLEVTFTGKEEVMLYQFQKPELEPGKIIQTEFSLSLSELFDTAEKGITVHAKMSTGQSNEEQVTVFSSRNLLNKFFATYLIPEWRYISPTSVPESIIVRRDYDDRDWSYWRIDLPELNCIDKSIDASREVWIRRKLVLPKQFTSLPVTISFGIPTEFVKSFYLNETVQEYKPIDFGLTGSAQTNEEYVFVLNLKLPTDKNIVPLLTIPCIKLTNPAVDDYFTGLEIGKKLYPQNKYESWEKNLTVLTRSVTQTEWDTFNQTADKIEKETNQLADFLRQNKIYLAGNSHIDMAWLWRWDETINVCRDTFTQALKFMDEFPEFCFSQSQAQAYLWMEEKYPDIFKKIQDKVKTGQWEIVGGMWVEPDCNLPSGESLARQLLYGKRYWQEKFGVDVKIGWNPDTFGYSWQLPQIYKKSGIDHFIFTKLTWNDTTEFPYNIFWWESPDGSRILSVMPNSYGTAINQDTLINDLVRYKKKNEFTDMLTMYGVGDHGGGPTREDINNGKRLSQTKTFPETKFSTTINYFTEIKNKTHKLPVWKDELYVETHRGTYTTQAKIKKANRQAETLLYNTEFWQTINSVLFNQKYPRKKMLSLWRKSLFNQFHDILPGSSIPGVYIDAEKDYREIFTQGNNLLTSTLTDMATRVGTDKQKGIPLIVYNSLPWVRNGWVENKLSRTDEVYNSVRVIDEEGNFVPVQIIGNTPTDLHFGFLATEVPATGYRTYWLSLNKRTRKYESSLEIHKDSLENEFYRIELDLVTGTIKRIYDKLNIREVVPPGSKANLLQTFYDRPREFDAWNIDANFETKKWDVTETNSVDIIEKGPVRIKLRVRKTFQNSEFVQDIILYANQPGIEFANTVKWDEKHILLKVAFPVTVDNEYANFEIPYGVIKRPTRRRTPTEKAKFEVPALKWADLTDTSGDYGVSLLNDCKYGYDVKDNLIRLTLLRSPVDPDPHADEGEHQFVYVLYPHQGDWRSALTVRKGYELNFPLIPVKHTVHPGTLPVKRSFLPIAPGNVILSTFKLAEDTEDIILRVYETEGKKTNVSIPLPLNIIRAEETDLLENKTVLKLNVLKNNVINFELTPWEIKTVKLTVK